MKNNIVWMLEQEMYDLKVRFVSISLSVKGKCAHAFKRNQLPEYPKRGKIWTFYLKSRQKHMHLCPAKENEHLPILLEMESKYTLVSL